MQTYFEDIVKRYMPEYKKTNKYNSIGSSFFADLKYYRGSYWFYESSDFIIDIHDLFIKEDYIETMPSDFSNYIFLVSNYIISGSGHWLKPYKSVEPDSVFIMDSTLPPKKYILHGNCRFFVVGIKFKQSMFEKHLLTKTDIKKDEISNIFLYTQNEISGKIKKLAFEILNCRMKNIPAELFFEAKAKEWLSITIDAYINLRYEPKILYEDENSVENVARYIEDHYAFDISQDFLTKIAAMSPTKLKNTFKKKYNMSITEFTQRKRMNMAEDLILTTNLDLKTIAKSVGYSSQSRFSTLYKRYKGILPGEAKKICKIHCLNKI